MREITLETTLLELVEAYPEASKIFERYNAQAGECILCYSLFEPLKKVIDKYRLNEESLLSELRAVQRIPRDASRNT